MNCEAELEELLRRNTKFINVGGHYFEGDRWHDQNRHPRLTMHDLKPLETAGRVRPVYHRNFLGSYVRAFIILLSP